MGSFGEFDCYMCGQGDTVWGFFVLFRKKKWEGLLCLVIIGYFLIVSGPVGYAKYRLPFEPILIVLLAIGLKDLWFRLRHWATP